MMIRTLALFALLSATPALAETTWSGTGPRGVSVDGSGSCTRLAGALTCNSASTLTGPMGKTATRTGTRVRDASGTTGTFTTTGQGGRSILTVRKRNW